MGQCPFGMGGKNEENSATLTIGVEWLMLASFSFLGFECKAARSFLAHGDGIPWTATIIIIIFCIGRDECLWH